MHVERARSDDAAAVRALVEEAAEFLTAHGIRQWAPGALPASLIPRGIARGEVWVVRAGGGLAASLTLEDEDLETWGASDGSALYLHRLVVARAHAGEGLGRRLLAWAGDEARARGRRSLRLDCVASNTFLRRYYADAGFAERGEVDVGRARLARFEVTSLSSS
jgi:GNAT superfamily N-acetyltransferase